MPLFNIDFAPAVNYPVITSSLDVGEANVANDDNLTTAIQYALNNRVSHPLFSPPDVSSNNETTNTLIDKKLSEYKLVSQYELEFNCNDNETLNPAIFGSATKLKDKKCNNGKYISQNNLVKSGPTDGRFRRNSDIFAGVNTKDNDILPQVTFRFMHKISMSYNIGYSASFSIRLKVKTCNNEIAEVSLPAFTKPDNTPCHTCIFEINSFVQKESGNRFAPKIKLTRQGVEWQQVKLTYFSQLHNESNEPWTTILRRRKAPYLNYFELWPIEGMSTPQQMWNSIDNRNRWQTLEPSINQISTVTFDENDNINSDLTNSKPSFSSLSAEINQINSYIRQLISHRIEHILRDDLQKELEALVTQLNSEIAKLDNDPQAKELKQQQLTETSKFIEYINGCKSKITIIAFEKESPDKNPKNNLSYPDGLFLYHINSTNYWQIDKTKIRIISNTPNRLKLY